jgi:GrpB-like predicted nucleotidyltransferase (UPF0157 family)
MPFDDEPFAHNVVIEPYQERWAAEGAELVTCLRELVPDALAIDHIGSTSVPGLPAKDCLDTMIGVRDVIDAKLDGLGQYGFRRRLELWNNIEFLDGKRYPKLVFAPPAGARSVNVHVRAQGSPTARYALLFRDYLRADLVSRRTWGEFKMRLAKSVSSDINAYGQIKAAIQPLLMTAAEAWVEAESWTP